MIENTRKLLEVPLYEHPRHSSPQARPKAGKQLCLFRMLGGLRFCLASIRTADAVLCSQAKSF